MKDRLSSYPSLSRSSRWPKLAIWIAVAGRGSLCLLFVYCLGVEVCVGKAKKERVGRVGSEGDDGVGVVDGDVIFCRNERRRRPRAETRVAVELL